MQARISHADIEVIERCAKSLGIILTAGHWTEIWQLLRAGSSAFSVLAEIGLTDACVPDPTSTTKVGD